MRHGWKELLTWIAQWRDAVCDAVGYLMVAALTNYDKDWKYHFPVRGSCQCEIDPVRGFLTAKYSPYTGRVYVHALYFAKMLLMDARAAFKNPRHPHAKDYDDVRLVKLQQDPKLRQTSLVTSLEEVWTSNSNIQQNGQLFEMF